MDYLSSVYKNIFSNTINLTPKEKIGAKAKTFLIDESLKINKLAFAFFLDRYKPENKINTANMASLSRYEWFAGSLTAEQFALSLHDFLQSPLSGSLTPEFRHSVQSFATALQKSENQGYLIDLLRSRDLKLILLILTGIPMGGQIDATAKEIGNISQHTVDDLKGLKPGDKRIYLVGDLFHETRLTVEKKEAEWEIGYFDSAQPQYKIFETKDPNPLLDQLFWDKVYTLKLKESSLAELENHIGKHFEQKKLPLHNIKVQSKNTCHFRGLLVALKHECLTTFHADPEAGLREWKAFKVAFGNYMLQNPNLNSKIKILASNQQAKRSQKTELTNLFQDSITQGRFEDSLKVYHAALHILGSVLQNERPGLSPMKTLNDLDEVFKSNLRNNLIHIDVIESGLKALKNPSINLSLEIFKNTLKAEQDRSEAALDEELYKARYDLKLIFEEIKQWEIFNNAEKANPSVSDTALEEKQNQPFADVNLIMQKIKREAGANRENIRNLSQFTPVSKKKLLEWLETVSNEPKLLTHLDQRHLFVYLLVQGIYLGEISKVCELYERLDSKDKEVLIKTLEDIRRNSSYFTAISLSDVLYEAYYVSPNHPLMASFAKSLMEKALQTSSLKDIYLLEKVNQGRILLSWESTESLKPTREQIEAFFAVVDEEDFNKLPLYLMENLLYPLMKQVVRSGELDIFNQTPEFIYNVCVELPQKNLPFDLPQESILNKLVLFQKSHENESKTRPLVFNDTITLNQYRYRQFDKLLDSAKSLEIKGRIFPEFCIDINPEDIIPLQNLLLKNKSDSLDDFILLNFMKSVPALKDRNLVTSFLQFCHAHKRKSLHRWLNLDEYPGPLKIPRENRLFILECVIGQPELFDEDLIERIIYMNVPSLDDETLHKIENWLVAMNKKELLLGSQFLRLMPYDLIEKYPDSLLVKKRSIQLVEE